VLVAVAFAHSSGVSTKATREYSAGEFGEGWMIWISLAKISPEPPPPSEHGETLNRTI